MSLSNPPISSAQELFTSNYSFLRVRQTHKAIRHAIADRSARLQSQVAAGYRELLGTAEDIVQMSYGASTTVNMLSGVESRCSSLSIGSKIASLVRLKGLTEKVGCDPDKADLMRTPDIDATVDKWRQTGAFPFLEHNNHPSPVAQRYWEKFRVIYHGAVICPVATSRLKLLEACAFTAQVHLGMKRRPPANALVTAAKTLVLGRLLANNLTHDFSVGSCIHEAAQAALKKLTNQHRRLLRAVGRLLSESDDTCSQTEILSTLCAYSLATNNSTREVTCHLMRMRSEAIASYFHRAKGSAEKSIILNVEHCLQLYARTLVDLQGLVPVKLSKALGSMAKTTIMSDPGTKAIECLQIDIFERWCSDEIRYFAPCICYDDLSGDEAHRILCDWYDQGAEFVLNGLKVTLRGISCFKVLTQLRAVILQLWIREGSKTRSINPSIMLDKLRAAMNEGMLTLISTKATKLQFVSSEIKAMLESWTEEATKKPENLWNISSLFNTDTIASASNLGQEVLLREYGRNTAVLKVTASYSSWRHAMDEVGDAVDHLRKARWESDFYEIEEEEAIRMREMRLNTNDPAVLEASMRKMIGFVFQHFEETIKEQWNSKRNSPNAGRLSMFLLRIIRDIRARLPVKLEQTSVFCLNIVPELHETLVKTVVSSPIEELFTKGLSEKAVAGRSLWVGEPQLPIWPSWWTFIFLRNICHAMEEAGIDLWSAVSLQLLRDHLIGRVGRVWRETLESSTIKAQGDTLKFDMEEYEIDGENPTSGLTPEEKVVATRELFIQWLFDILTIRCCLEISGQDQPDDLKTLTDIICSRIGSDNTVLRLRLDRAANEYWGKTRSLFGLLEGSQNHS